MGADLRRDAIPRATIALTAACVAAIGGDVSQAAVIEAAVLATLIGAVIYGIWLRELVPRGPLPSLPPSARVVQPTPASGRLLLLCAALAAGLALAVRELFGADEVVDLAGASVGYALANVAAIARVAVWERRHGVELVAPVAGPDEDGYEHRRFGRLPLGTDR
ncbi:MAG TPA: hypothetical protein VIL49_02950 [Capillimicrobium sp.]